MFLCLADAVHNAAGFGVSGFDRSGRVAWDLVSNVHIWEIEASSLIHHNLTISYTLDTEVFIYGNSGCGLQTINRSVCV